MRTLAHRAAHPELYARGSYEPLAVSGPSAEHAITFRRVLGTDELIVVAPRLIGGLIGTTNDAPTGERWRETTIELEGVPSGRRYRNAFTGETIAVGDGGTLAVEDLLRGFPLALLTPTS